MHTHTLWDLLHLCISDNQNYASMFKYFDIDNSRLHKTVHQLFLVFSSINYWPKLMEIYVMNIMNLLLLKSQLTQLAIKVHVQVLLAFFL